MSQIEALALVLLRPSSWYLAPSWDKRGPDLPATPRIKSRPTAWSPVPRVCLTLCRLCPSVLHRNHQHGPQEEGRAQTGSCTQTPRARAPQGAGV